MNWDTLEQEIAKLAKMISTKPDILVGIVKGGIIPARLLAQHLGVDEMYCLTVKKIDQKRIVVTEITTDIKNKQILLVEDILETGRSLVYAKEYLEKKGAIVQTASLYKLPTSEIIPDYFLNEITEVYTLPW